MLARLRSLPRPGRRATVTTVVALTLVGLAACIAVGGVLSTGVDATALRDVSRLSAGAAAAAFGVATVLVVATRRLVPGLWGYVPGLACVVASALAAGAA